MTKFIARYTQTNDLEIEIEAKDQEEAKIIADKILENMSYDETLNKSQKGYWENWAIDEDEE